MSSGENRFNYAAAKKHTHRGDKRVMKSPNIISVKEVNSAVLQGSRDTDGDWIPARPLGFVSWRERLRATWLVFTGQADALIWPEADGLPAEACQGSGCRESKPSGE